MSVPLPPSPTGPAYPVPPPGFGPPAAATPLLPRRAALPLTLLLLPLLAFVFFAPIALLAAGGHSANPALMWMHFKEGGWGMWVVMLCQMLVCPVFLALGALMLRGKRVPGAVLFMLALLPFVASLLGTLQAMQMIVGALAGESVDPSQKARIMAMGISEMSNLAIYGGTAAGAAMYAAGTIGALSLVAIDTGPLQPAPRSAAWIIAMPAGAGAAIVAVVLRVAMHLSLSMLDALVIFGLLTSGLLAGFAGRPLPGLVKDRNDDEAGPAFRLLVLAAVALAAAMFFVDRAASSVEARSAFGAIAGESVDPSQKARILGLVVESYRGRPVVTAVDVILCLAVFAAPIASSFGAKRKVSVASIAGGIVGALVALLALLAGWRTMAALAATREPFVKMEQALAESGVAVPTIRAADHTTMLSGGLQLFIKRDGSVIDRRAPDMYSEIRGVSSDVAADAAVPFDLFVSKAAAALAKPHESARIGLVVTPAERPDLAPLGPFAGLVGTHLLIYPLALNAKLTDGLPPPKPRYSWSEPRAATSRRVLAVLPGGDTARLLVLSSSARLFEVESALSDTLPLGDTSSAAADRRQVLSSIRARRSGMDTILLAPAPGETMAQVVVELEAIASAIGSSEEVELALTGDRSALEEAKDTPSSSRANLAVRDLAVIGALPKETVERSLRQNAASLSACYRSAKGGDGADVPQEIPVRFVVDASGSASKVTATTGKSKAFGVCVASAVGKIVFPAPDRGVASVAVKLGFN